LTIILAMTGDDLRDFVNQKLFSYLHGFKQKASGPNTIEYKIGEIFGRSKTRSPAAIICGRSSSTSMPCASAPNPKSTSSRTFMKPRSRTWATRGATAANITPPGRLSGPWCRRSGPGSATRFMTGPAARRASCARPSIICAPGRILTTQDFATLQTRTFYGNEMKSLAIRYRHHESDPAHQYPGGKPG
jgi:type I restriction enzyme M protein